MYRLQTQEQEWGTNHFYLRAHNNRQECPWKTHEENEVEAAAADDDAPSPPTLDEPRKYPVVRLSGDMKDYKFGAIVGVGKIEMSTEILQIMCCSQ